MEIKETGWCIGNFKLWIMRKRLRDIFKNRYRDLRIKIIVAHFFYSKRA